MADWNGFRKNGTTYIPNDATARAGVIANTKLIKDTVGWSGKNLLKNTSSTQTKNGVTFTVNTDGSVSTSGTSSADNVSHVINSAISLKAGKYILSGITGGSPNTYRLVGSGSVIEDFIVYDGEQEFTVTADGTISVTLLVRYSAVNMNDKIIKPMIRDANILDDTYEPYFGSTAFPRSEQAVLGAKNLLKYPYLGSASGLGNVTITPNNDGSLALTAGTTENTTANYVLHSRTVYDFQLPKGTYKFTGGISDKVYFAIAKNRVTGDSSQGGVALTSDYGNGAIFTLDETSDVQVILGIEPNTTVVAQTIKPMIRLASDPDSDFIPYAMTNKELTEKVAANVVDIKTDFKTALMSATGSTVTDVETATLTTYGDLMILNSRINKAANTGINCNVTVPFSVIPKTKGTVYVSLHSPYGAGTASFGASSATESSLALRYNKSDEATYVDLTLTALMDK